MNDMDRESSTVMHPTPPSSHAKKESGSGIVIPCPTHLTGNYATLYDTKSKSWSCTCKHYRVHGSDCRHILEKKYENLRVIYQGVLEKIGEHRDSRDYECKSFDEVIEGNHRVELVHRLCLLVQRIALEQGSVCSDDLHAVTNEMYRDDRIIGTVFGILLKQGVIECVGRRATVRKCAHGRGIGVYALVKKEKELPVVSSNQMSLDLFEKIKNMEKKL